MPRRVPDGCQEMMFGVPGPLHQSAQIVVCARVRWPQSNATKNTYMINGSVYKTKWVCLYTSVERHYTFRPTRAYTKRSRISYTELGRRKPTRIRFVSGYRFMLFLRLNLTKIII